MRTLLLCLALLPACSSPQVARFSQPPADLGETPPEGVARPGDTPALEQEASDRELQEPEEQEPEAQEPEAQEPEAQEPEAQDPEAVTPPAELEGASDEEEPDVEPPEESNGTISTRLEAPSEPPPME